MIERLPSQSRKAFNYEAQIAKIEEEIERYQKLKLGFTRTSSAASLINRNTSSSAAATPKSLRTNRRHFCGSKKKMKQTVTTGTTERNWVTLFKQYETSKS